MEAFCAKKRILFPDQSPKPVGGTKKQLEAWAESSNVVVWKTIEDLLRAIDKGQIPVTPKRKRPLLTRDTPNLDFWVGKQVCFGRPLFKKHWKFLRSHVNPLSSWIARLGEDEDDEVCGLRSPQAGEGTEVIQAIFGSKIFQYPKPMLLIKELLAQATRPGDTVLDFFAGSGTTGQAVLELNAEDGGQRRFILCSSTEATAKEPAKTLCRDVCAERVRRVMAGYGGKPGYPLAQGGEFAYLQLDKMDGADVALDATAHHAATLLCMRNAAIAPVEYMQTAMQVIAKGPDWLLVLCTHTDADVLQTLARLPAQHGVARLVVVAPRPKAVALWLAEHGVEAQTQSLREVLTQGQGGRQGSFKQLTGGQE